MSSADARPVTPTPRHWQRFTPAERAMRSAFYLGMVIARFIGFAAYQLDSNLRNSALVGIVGGGGIGATLLTAFQRFDYDFVLTIVLAIIAVVMVGEVVSGFMRRLFQ